MDGGLHMGGETTRRRAPLGQGYTWALTVLFLAVKGGWTLNRPRTVPEWVNKRAGGEFRGWLWWCNIVKGCKARTR
jgi:hypothetical protein